MVFSLKITYFSQCFSILTLHIYEYYMTYTTKQGDNSSCFVVYPFENHTLKHIKRHKKSYIKNKCPLKNVLTDSRAQFLKKRLHCLRLRLVSSEKRKAQRRLTYQMRQAIQHPQPSILGRPK